MATEAFRYGMGLYTVVDDPTCLYYYRAKINHGFRSGETKYYSSFFAGVLAPEVAKKV